MKSSPARAPVLHALAVLALGACAPACSTDSSTPDGGGKVAIAPISRAPTSKGVSFDSAELALSEVSLLACTQDAASLFVQDFPIELFYQPSPHILFESAVTDFCGVDLELAPTQSDALPDLQSLTALFRGTRADTTPFEIQSTVTASFQFRTSGALDAQHLVLGADLERWLAGVDLDAADASDGSVLVDTDHNPDLLAAFDAGAMTAFALYADSNGDGALTDSELEPVATATTP